MGQPLLFISAGDPSGDNATARLIEDLKQQKPNLGLFGLGGPRLSKLGQEQLADPADLAVLGFWEVAKRYFYFRELFKRCVAEIETRRPGAILLVDYPGFNLRLAKKIKHLGIPIIYYISPQVWAWGKGRLPQIRKLIDQMLVILPFEEQFYREHDVACKFVGHYLLEDIPAEYIASPLPAIRQLALLPGSRRQEIERMLPVMLETAARLYRNHGYRSVIAGISGAYDYESVCQQYADLGVTVVYDNARKTVYESDLVLTASGTATLEVGLIGRPMVVIYKTGFLTYQIARRLVTLENIGLVNLVLGETVVPELIQGDASPDKIATALERFVSDDNYRDNVVAKLRQLPNVLGSTADHKVAAESVAGYL